MVLTVTPVGLNLDLTDFTDAIARLGGTVEQVDGPGNRYKVVIASTEKERVDHLITICGLMVVPGSTA